MKKLIAGAAVAAASLVAVPAMAATTFVSTFESVPGAPAPGNYRIYTPADGILVDGWTPNTEIEIQNHVAGNPQSPDGGNFFVELDANQNSAMDRTIDAGTYNLSFLYSPRPNVALTSNGIDVLLNGIEIFTTTGLGGGATAWSVMNVPVFTATAGSLLTFRASGTSDSLGGYIDNISLSAAVPEPGTWLMMLLGFVAVGATMRGARRKDLRVKFA